MKTWHKPQLIVLVRSRPEEAILTVCKDIFAGNAALNTWPGCAFSLGPGVCQGCNEPSSS